MRRSRLGLRSDFEGAVAAAGLLALSAGHGRLNGKGEGHGFGQLVLSMDMLSTSRMAAFVKAFFCAKRFASRLRSAMSPAR